MTGGYEMSSQKRTVKAIKITDNERCIQLLEESIKQQSCIDKLTEAINFAIQCLTSGNSVAVSDPRPALKVLKDVLK